MEAKRIFVSLLVLLFVSLDAAAGGEAQNRWELMNQIRQEKFDLILPQVRTGLSITKTIMPL